MALRSLLPDPGVFLLIQLWEVSTNCTQAPCSQTLFSSLKSETPRVGSKGGLPGVVAGHSLSPFPAPNPLSIVTLTPKPRHTHSHSYIPTPTTAGSSPPAGSCPPPAAASEGSLISECPSRRQNLSSSFPLQLLEPSLTGPAAANPLSIRNNKPKHLRTTDRGRFRRKLG